MYAGPAGCQPPTDGVTSREDERILSDRGPETIGRYHILRELGQGAMGVVYEAEDPLLGRRVALKTIHRALSADPTSGEMFEKRFFAEAKAAASLSHPGIVVVHDVGRDETGRLFIALEHLVGQTLEERLAGGQALAWAEALRVAKGVAEALHHAHSRGIIHRDIKPGNVMVLESGEPKILDFGIARLPMSDLTTGGATFGSPSYMAPERMDGKTPEPPTDVFSLGAVLYEMLTGQKAFAGKDLATIVRKVCFDEPMAPSRLKAGVPTAADALVARALAKVADQRYPTARAFAEDLDDAGAGRPLRHAGSGAPARAAVPAASKPQAPKAAPARPAETGKGTIRAGAVPGLALPPGKRVSLAILEGARQGERFGLSQPRIVIGRAGGGVGADIEVDDPETSRGHAAIECYGTRILIKDLESTNGTWVSEVRVTQADLQNHDEFRVGRTRFMLIVTDPD